MVVDGIDGDLIVESCDQYSASHCNALSIEIG